MKSYWDYLRVTWLIACVLIVAITAATLPLILAAWAIASGVWPLAIPAVFLYVPVFAGFTMALDRLDGK